MPAVIWIVLSASTANKKNSQAVIQSAASTLPRRGCIGSQLDQVLKFCAIWGGLASGRLDRSLITAGRWPKGPRLWSASRSFLALRSILSSDYGTFHCHNMLNPSFYKIFRFCETAMGCVWVKSVLPLRFACRQPPAEILIFVQASKKSKPCILGFGV